MPRTRPKFLPEELDKILDADGTLDAARLERWRRTRRAKGLPDSMAALAREITGYRLLQHMEDCRKALLDLALGHWEEKTTPDGQQRVYKTPPDIKALKEVNARLFGTAVSVEDARAAEAKARVAEAEVAAKLQPAKVSQLQAQTARAEIDTKVYAMSQMDQKEIGRKFKALLNACLSWVTMTPRGTMAKACETDEAWQQYKADFGAKLKAKARDILLNDDDSDLQTAITAGDD